MNNFLTILKFELKSFWKKSFILLSVFLVIVLAVILFSPRFMPLISGLFSDGDSEEKISIVINAEISESESFYNFLETSLDSNSYEIIPSTGSLEEIKSMVKSGEHSRGLYIDSLDSYTSIESDIELGDFTGAMINDSIKAFISYSQLKNLNIPDGSVNSILNPYIEEVIVQTGVDQTENFAYSYALILILYFAILMYGQQIVMSVATEKNSRAMEVLITSANSTTFIFAKVVAAGLAGFLQLIFLVGSGILFYNLNSQYWSSNSFLASFFDVPLYILFYMLFFFITGFFIYAFLFGAAGSIVSKIEDVNISSLPVMLCFIATFLVTMFSISTGNVDGVLLKVASYFPLTSPMAMFARIAMSQVAAIEIIISLAILVVSTFLIGYISAKIYRLGVLSYGNKANFFTFLKLVFRNK